MADLVLALSELENVVLSIVATGESVRPIGPWAKAIEILLGKGLVRNSGDGSYTITEAGKAAYDQMETEEMRGMIGEHNARVREQAAPVIDGEIVGEDDQCP